MGIKYLGIILMISYLLNTTFHLLLLRPRINFDLGINPSSLYIVEKPLLKQHFLSVLGYIDALYRHASASALKALDVVYHTALSFITDDALSLITASCTTSLGGPLSVRGVIYICSFLFIKPLLENCLHTYFPASLVY